MKKSSKILLAVLGAVGVGVGIHALRKRKQTEEECYVDDDATYGEDETEDSAE